MAVSKSKRRARARQNTLIALLYGLLTLLMTWPLAPNSARAIPGDGFDGWQNYWNLWWVKVALVDQIRSPFQTDLLYYPTGVDLYFHTLNPFNGLITLPIQVSTRLLLAYNGVVFLSWTLGGLGMYLLTRWVLRPRVEVRPNGGIHSWLPPFLAGLVFTFAPFHMAHLLGHMQVMSLQWIPFYALYLLRTLDRKRHGLSWLRSASLAALFLAFCGLCDWYFVLYLFFFTGLLILWHLLADFVRAWKRRDVSVVKLASTWLIPPLLIGLLFFLLLSPILVPMIRTASQLNFMVRPEADFYVLSASVADFFIPNRLHTLFRESSGSWVGNQVAPLSERTIAIGYVALLLAACSLWVDRKRSGFWAACALFFGVLALGPVVHWDHIEWCDIAAHVEQGLPVPAERCPSAETRIGREWSLFSLLNRVVPFMEISRSVSRYALMVQFGVSVLVGVGLSGLLQGLRTQSWRTYLTLLLVPVVLAEYWVAPYPLSEPDTPSVFEDIAVNAPGVGADRSISVLNLPMNYDRPGYLLYQTVHQRPLTVAYISRDDPRTLTERVPVLQHLRHLGPDILDVNPVSVGKTVFRDLGIEYVTLDRYKMPGGEERAYTTALAQDIFADQTPFYEDERMTVYRLEQEPSQQQRPYLLLGPLHWGPLRKNEASTRYRAILDGPAQLMVRPGSLDSAPPMGLNITYRTLPDANARVRLRGSDPVALRATEVSQTVSVPLNWRSATSEDVAHSITLLFIAGEPESLFIERIQLSDE